MTDLTSLTIAEAREGLASKSFTAAELTDAHLAAIEAARVLNAYVLETPDRAREMAKAADEKIAKGEGDAPVQAYIAAMPGWKSEVGRRLDALIVRTIPGVHKAVKWNSPLYGIAGEGWFLGIHVFTRYIKVAFFRGSSLRPVPPGESKQQHTRYLDIHENDELDEAQFTAWVKQASRLPGERM